MIGLGLGIGLGQSSASGPAPVTGAIASTLTITCVAAGSVVNTGDPSTISGLKLWLDPTIVTGNPIGTWPDQSGQGNDLTGTGTQRPAPGTGINGHTTVDWAAGNFLGKSAAISTIISASAWTVLVVFNYTGARAEQTNVWTDAGLICDSGAFWGAFVSTTKTSAYNWDGAEKKAQPTTTTSTNYYAIFRYDGTNVSVSINGGAFTNTASGNLTTLTGLIRLGASTGGSGPFIGSMGDVAVWNKSLSGSEVTQMQNWASGRYGI